MQIRLRSSCSIVAPSVTSCPTRFESCTAAPPPNILRLGREGELVFFDRESTSIWRTGIGYRASMPPPEAFPRALAGALDDFVECDKFMGGARARVIGAGYELAGGGRSLVDTG